MTGVSPLDIMKEISTVLPPRDQLKVEVTDISVSKDRVTLDGVVADFKAVDTVRQSLEKSGAFANVTSGNVRKGVKGEVKFSMSMDIVLGKEGEGGA